MLFNDEQTVVNSGGHQLAASGKIVCDRYDSTIVEQGSLRRAGIKTVWKRALEISTLKLYLRAQRGIA